MTDHQQASGHQAHTPTPADVSPLVKGGAPVEESPSHPGMAKALMDAADARVGEIEGAR